MPNKYQRAAIQLKAAKLKSKNESIRRSRAAAQRKAAQELIKARKARKFS